MPKLKARNVRGFKCVNILVQKVMRKVRAKTKSRIRGREWYNDADNKARKAKTDKANYDKDPKKKTKKTTAYRKKQRENPTVRLYESLRARLRDFLDLSSKGRNKSQRTMSMVGLNAEDLQKYLLEKRGDDKLNLNYEVDHTFPCVRFKDAQAAMMMHHTNLQFLTLSENRNKSAKLPTKAMAAKVDRSCWPDGITEDMLPDIYPGWATPLRM